MFAEGDVTPFEELTGDVTNDDTYKLASPHRFNVLEDQLEEVRANATRDIYVDDKDELNDRYAEGISTLLALRNSLDTLADELTTTYRIRQEV